MIPLCILLSEPVSSRLLNSISTKLVHQNKQFNVYTTTSKQQEGSTCKNAYPKCFITYFDKCIIHLHFIKDTTIRYKIQLVRLLCPDIFQFHCACLRTEICLRELTLSRTLNPNQKSSRSLDSQFSHKLLFYVH